MVYPTRHKKDRREKLTALRGGTTGAPVDILLNEWPVVILLPRFPMAGALRLADPEDAALDISREGFWLSRPPDKELLATMTKHGVDHLQTGMIETRTFSRFLAKIAHCVAVYDFGLDGFEPFLNDYIINGAGRVNYWVGSYTPDQPPAPLRHEVLPMVHPVGTIIVNIRLFPHLGAPTYHVITGHRRPGRLPKGYVVAGS